MNHFYLDIFCQQQFKHNQRICGDVFLSQRIKEEKRTILVLSDGMGHGVKANILATLTATMAVSFTKNHRDHYKIAEILMNTLPVCSVRKMSYATFTIIDIEPDGLVHIIEYDNPKTLVFRGRKSLDVGWQCMWLNNEKFKGKEILTCTFQAQKEDRIVTMTDGIVQAGMGTNEMPFGWEIENVEQYIAANIQKDKTISAEELAEKIVKKAVKHDAFMPGDDTSACVVYFREPRSLLICTGPPFDKQNDKIYAQKLKEFNGKKILCGATTADIIAREWNETITDTLDFIDPDLPPISYMNGVDLITEGILTLTKVFNLLKNFKQEYLYMKGPAHQILKMLIESDYITFIIGTKINEAHQDPNLPMDIEIRRTVIRQIAQLLEEKWLKTVYLEYI
ncbi:MAG TPA: SpoIIE family protein phosphatase [Bacteroidales bacterium]|jgi:sulfur transfer complex TusBCD TusB component (DsrH family)|nr:SpoIIE family protein phosphatase [Bacteroidales bacterium]